MKRLADGLERRPQRLWIGAFLLATLSIGCGGSGPPPIPFDSQDGLILVADQQLPGGFYGDVWTFVPNASNRAAFKMCSTSMDCRIILADASGSTVAIGFSSGPDDNGLYSCSLGAVVVQGETYTLTTTTNLPNTTGAYTVFWEDWAHLTVPGD